MKHEARAGPDYYSAIKGSESKLDESFCPAKTRKRIQPSNIREDLRMFEEQLKESDSVVVALEREKLPLER